jgi:hypothetical protein
MEDPKCECCEGTQILTPVSIANRPGLSSLAYRVGTHARFLETMKARLSNAFVETPDPDDPTKTKTTYPLQALTTRLSNDFSIALLDAWATVGDVLTFYQERFANEGFLRTATERRSVLELGRLIGYSLRPGVASTVYLAYSIDDIQKTPVEIPIGTRSQSLPGPGELPQMFETSEVVEARSEWNAIKPRLSRPQYILPSTDTIYLKGIATQLKPNDPLLIIDSLGNKLFRRVLRAEIEAEYQRTKVILTIKAEFDFELAELETWVNGPLPEEEGPYSRSIADDLLVRMRAGALTWIGLLKDEKRSAREWKHEGDKQADLLEQTIRILRALNFEQLVAWSEKLLERVNAVLLKIAPKADAKEPDANDKRTIDLSKFMELRSDERTTLTPAQKKKTYAREIVRSEIDEIKKADGAMEQLAAIVADTRKATDEKVAAIDSSVSLLQEFELVFTTLGFLVQAAWIRDLENALLAAVSSPITPLVNLVIRSSAIAQPLFLKDFFIPSLPILKRIPQFPLPSKIALKRPVATIFASASTISTSFVEVLGSVPKETLRQAKKNTVLQSGPARVYALRTTASLFGYNVQRQVKTKESAPYVPDLPSTWPDWPPEADEAPNVAFLDRAYDAIVPGSYVVIQKAGELDSQAQKFSGVEAMTQPRSAYGLTTKSTRLKLASNWHAGGETYITSFIRGTTVYAQSELLDLAEGAISQDIERNSDTIVLDDLYDGLESGRTFIISGERRDIEGTTGVHGSERVVLLSASEGFIRIRRANGEEVNLPSDVNQADVIDLPGDRLHTSIHLAGKLTYSYKRDTVTIYGNVVKATHGETRNEILGNGDGSRVFQAFDLKQPPLTFVPAPNPTGVDSTLHIYINDVEWHEVDTFAGLAPVDHRFITRTNNDGKTTAIFGNGKQGARLPTGAANIRAVYRNGIGKPGNVKAEQISMLISRPLGVKGVINPLRASGGVDKENRDQARRNIPVFVKSLDRLISVQDYADFARTFAGIGKAKAAHLNNGYRQLVQITIAGLDEDAIPRDSDLFQNLNRALRKFGDPDQFIQVDLRKQALLAIKAYIQLDPDYLWEKVEPKIRAGLLDTFSYERRELGQSVQLSEVFSAIQKVPGVVYSDIDLLDTISEDEADDPEVKLKGKFETLASGQSKPKPRIIAHLARLDKNGIQPAELIFLTPEIPETLILEELHK